MATTVTRQRTRSKPAARRTAASSRIKRVKLGGRILRQPKSINKDDSDRMHALLKLISENDFKMLEISKQRELATEELFRLMKTYRMPHFKNEYGDADIETVMGRAVNTISPEEFRSEVTDEEFMSCISVNATKAKEILPEKTLKAITDTTPAKKKGEVLKVSPAKRD